MPIPSLPISPPWELLSGLVITILILTIMHKSISSCFQFLAKTQFMWPPDSPFHPSNTASSHLSAPAADDEKEQEEEEEGKELGVVQCKPKGDSGELVQCAVCLCNIEEGEEMRELRCEHHFHRGCLEAWLGYRHFTCPICREALPREAARKLVGWAEGAELEGLMLRILPFWPPVLITLAFKIHHCFFIELGRI